MISLSNMNFTIATDHQLLTIIKHDKNLPSSLLRGAVIEMLNRGLFDSLIADCILKTFPNLVETEKKLKIDMDDFMQIGRETVYKALERYNSKKGMAYTSFAYLAVKSELLKVQKSFTYKKRDISKVTSMNNTFSDGEEYAELFADSTNVEKYVVNKIMAEQLLTRINEHQKKVVLYKLQGFSFSEIAEILGGGKSPSVFRSYKRAIENMREGA